MVFTLDVCILKNGTAKIKEKHKCRCYVWPYLKYPFILNDCQRENLSAIFNVKVVSDITKYEQECIPVACIPPAAVAIPRGLHQAPPGSRHPPRTRHPPNQAPSGTRHPPGTRHPRTRHPPNQAPPLPGAGTPWAPDPPPEQNDWHTGVKT